MKKTWLITGSARGLGRALTEAALNAGHGVVATARSPAALNDLASQYAGLMLPLPLDVTDASAAKAAVMKAIDQFGRLDVVVNNAGYGDLAPIEDTTIDSFREQLETNLFGTINVTKAALPLFRQQRAGRFIQISSIGGRAGAIGRGAYSAAKFGVEGFSEVLAAEMRPFGVHVTIVEPGGFRTDFAGSSSVITDGNPEYAETVGRVATMQREYDGNQPGDPAKAARAIVGLADESNPPLRLVLGSDAYERARASDAARATELAEWRRVSVSTDI